MAPNFADSQHNIIRDMLLSKRLNNVQIAKVASCSERLVKTIRSNLRCFGTTRAPPNGSPGL